MTSFSHAAKLQVSNSPIYFIRSRTKVSKSLTSAISNRVKSNHFRRVWKLLSLTYLLCMIIAT